MESISIKNYMHFTFKLIQFSLASFFLISCYSVQKKVEESMPLSQEIVWPLDYEPSVSKFFVHNEIEINASPEIVWNILINAGEWENYYDGASDLVLSNNTSGFLNESSVFTWKTMGLDFKSTIKEFKPPYRLAWESNKDVIDGYHAWLIIPTENGSKLITSEAQHGFMTLPQKLFVPNKLHGLHDTWLSEIKRIAEEKSNQTNS